MTTTPHRVDGRSEHTRQAIQRAFRELVQIKGFTATSIRAVAERANVHRGTFYLHFADKYTLADAVVRTSFREELARALPAAPGWDQRSLRTVAEAVLECLERKYRHQTRPLFALAEVAPLVERAMQAELTELLLTWLREGRSAPLHYPLPQAQIARMAGWAIFGTALQWSQEPQALASGAMANAMVQLLMDGMGRLLQRGVP